MGVSNPIQSGAPTATLLPYRGAVSFNLSAAIDAERLATWIEERIEEMTASRRSST
jgi:hypothetical protein